MRRSMKRLKTFKQLRRGESTTTDSNVMQLEEINGRFRSNIELID